MLVAEVENDVAHLRQVIDEKDKIIAQQEKRIDELELELSNLRHQLDNLIRDRFGQRSEKDIEDDDSDGDEEPPLDIEFESVGGYKRKKRKNRSERFPDSLARVNVYYDINEKDKQCPCGCGAVLRKMSDVVTQELVVIPESLYIRCHIRPKYGGCQFGSQIITAPMLPIPIQKGFASAEMIAEIAVNKFADHLPLYRQEQRFARHGIELSRQTMCDWLAAGAELLLELIDLIKGYMLSNPIIHTDDTPTPVLSPGNKKTKTGRLWVYAGRGGDKAKNQHDYIFYDYSSNRRSYWPHCILSGYSGYIQADAFPGYDPLFRHDDGKEKETFIKKESRKVIGKAIEIACWMHARRNFYNIAKNTKKRGLAYQAVQYIKRLYVFEKQAKNMTVQERYEFRKQEAYPVLEEFKAWLDDKRTQVMEKTPICDAINYCLNQWAALCRYLDDGRLEIDNGYAERLIKGPCIGKKNYLFFGSDYGGVNATVYYTLIQSALLYKLNPGIYLTDVLRRLKCGLYNSLEDLLPHRWQPLNPFEKLGDKKDNPIIVSRLLELLSQPPPS